MFRYGVPGNQLNGALLAKGPFQMGNVGDIATVAEKEWQWCNHEADYL